MADTGNFLATHPGRDRATPTTPVEIDGATQIWHLSAHCAQFRAPAFPSPVPCRSRCRALAGLARARTSDDIRLRALCTPPPKSFAPTPGPFASVQYCHGHQGVVSIVSRPGCTSGPTVTFAPQHTLRALRVRTLCAERPPAGFRVISKHDRRCWPVKRPRHRLQTNPTPRQAMLADGRTVIGYENWRAHQACATLE